MRLFPLFGVAILLAAFHATAQQFGSEIAVNAPIYGLSNIARSVAVASNGSQFLVVWTTRYGGAFASRVTSDGALLEPAGIPLNDPKEIQPRAGAVSVASAGGSYLVVWDGNDGTIYTRVIQPDGTLEDVKQLPVQGCGIQLSSTGAFYVLTTRCGKVFGFILDSNGQLVGPEFTLGQARKWSVVADSSGFLFLEWIDGRPVARKYDLGGRASESVLLPPTGTMPTVAASNGSEYLVAWLTAAGVRAARLNQEGRLIAEDVPLSNRPASSLSISAEDDEFVLIVLELGQPRMVRSLTVRSGAVVAEAVLDTVTTWQSASIASGAGRHFVAAIRDVSPATAGGGTFDASIGWILDHEGPSIERVLPAGMGAADQSTFASESNGQSLLVAWEEFDSDAGRTAVRANIIDPVNGPMSREGVRLFDFPSEQRTPTVGFDGKNYLVVWQDNGAIVGQRLSSRGELTGEQLLISGSGREPTLAFDGTNFLVVWVIDRGIEAARVTPTGLVLDIPAIMVDRDDHAHYAPDVAWNGRSFLLVWHKRFMPFSVIPGVEMLVGAAVDSDTGAVSKFGRLISNAVGESIASVAKGSVECGTEICLVIASKADSLVAVTIPLRPSPGRRRPVWRNRLFETLVVAERGYWPSPRSLVVSDAGFFLAVQRVDGTVIGIRFSDLGEKLSETELDLESGGVLRRVGRLWAYLFPRVTADRTYGGARRLFIRLSSDPLALSHSRF